MPMRFPLALVPVLLLTTASIAGAAPPAKKAPGQPAARARSQRKECSTPKDCRLKGREYYYGKGVPKNLAKAAEFYDFACAEGDAWGCYNLADLHSRGEGVADDQPKALALFGKSCELGSPDGCGAQGIYYRDGKGGAAKDDKKAVQLFQKSCDGNVAFGCRLLGWMHSEGRGVAKADPLKAVPLDETACTGGDMYGCGLLGWHYEKGSGVKKSLQKAKELYKQACDDGQATFCDSLRGLPI
jgi:uncharacterized protein